jgi:hypothetical protein
VSSFLSLQHKKKKRVFAAEPTQASSFWHRAESKILQCQRRVVNTEVLQRVHYRKQGIPNANSVLYRVRLVAFGAIKKLKKQFGLNFGFLEV